MTFTPKELALIAAAKKKSRGIFFSRTLILIALMIGLTLMLSGVLAPDHFAYAAVAAVFFSVAMPQFGTGPKYEDLVSLLESKTARKTLGEP